MGRFNVTTIGSSSYTKKTQHAKAKPRFKEYIQFLGGQTFEFFFANQARAAEVVAGFRPLLWPAKDSGLVQVVEAIKKATLGER